MTKWKEPAVPRHAVQMVVMDLNEKIILLHRSNNVRSARNVWSIPTGLHDIGETVDETIRRELFEECGLEPATGFKSRCLFQYENIAGDKDSEEQYHWVISVYLVTVNNVEKAENKEPDKHDKMEFVDRHVMFFSDEWKRDHTFHESLDSILVPMLKRHL